MNDDSLFIHKQPIYIYNIISNNILAPPPPPSNLPAMEWGNGQLSHSVTPCDAVAPCYVASRYRYMGSEKNHYSM